MIYLISLFKSEASIMVNWLRQQYKKFYKDHKKEGD